MKHVLYQFSACNRSSFLTNHLKFFIAYSKNQLELFHYKSKVYLPIKL